MSDLFKSMGIGHNLRTRLTVSFGIAILIPSLITAIVGVKMIQKHVFKEAQSKVNSDLEAAKDIYQTTLDRLKNSLRIHATRRILYGALSNGDMSELGPEMERIRLEERLDFLSLADTQGNIFYSVNIPNGPARNLGENELIRRALYHRTPLAATHILSAQDLAAESPALAQQAYMELTRTQKARPTEQKVLASGMVLAGAAPVFTPVRKFVGVLYGGVLLNRNYEIVDKIRETLFSEGSVYKGRETGTATIFQDDVRISTNVIDEDGSRAITTRASAEVTDWVLHKGRTWKGRAFVVHDWYISAYTPIKDIQEHTIGMLYVGVLERPYRDSLWQSLAVFLGIALLGVAIVGIVAMRVAQRIAYPIRAMAMAALKVGDGDYSQKVEVRSRDEIGHLAVSFNKMVADLDDTHQALTGWTETLEQKVEERTAALKAMQGQLIQAEKLAGIGKLAAGVAHEINNPLTGILTNSSLMLEDTPAGDPRRGDLQTIVDETLRCRKIVKGLLDFARQSKPQKQMLSLNQVVEDVLALVRNQANFRNITLSTDFKGDLPLVMADRDQMRQVVLNIILNAADAMPNGGDLHIWTATSANGRHAEMVFKDSGPGIPSEILDKLFEPFFTTKKTGTGLGLSIAYGILERHGGTIRVDSTQGRGTTVTLVLPVDVREA